MSDLLKQFLAEQGYETDPMARVMQEQPQPEQPVVTPQADPFEELRKDPIAAAVMAQQEQQKEEAGFGDVFGYYAVEPILGLAQVLEKVTDGAVNLDEEAALAFREGAEKVIADNPILGTAAALSGALIGIPGVSVAGRVAGGGAKLMGAGARTQKAVEFGTTGATYGALIPELREGETSAPEAALGGAIGAGLGALTGGRVTPERLARIRQVNAKVPEAPEIKPKTAVGRSLSNVAGGLDYIAGSLSTRIGLVSPEILGRFRRFEYDAKKVTSDLYGKVENFVTGVSRIKGQDKIDLDKALLNGDHDIAVNILKRNNARLLPEFYKAKKVLEDVRTDLVKAGYKDLGNIENYWPRLVKDYKGLLSELGAEQRNAIQKAMIEYANRKGIRVDDIPADERSNVIGLVLRGFGPKVSTKSGQFAKQRTIDSVDDKLLPYYATPEESVEFYLRSTAHNVAKNRLLGKHAEADDSIQSMIDELVESNRLTNDEASKLVPLLQARLINGEMAPSAFIKGVRDFGYATTIANPLSALVQLGDIAQSTILSGVRNSIASMFGKKKITVDDIGLRDTIIQELNEGHKALDKLFRISQFKRFDRLGKETFINSKFKDATQKLQTERGTAEFRQKWSRFYGEDTDQLIADLRNGNVTDTVKFHLFNELSGIQPVSLLEMPEAYLRSPNGRIFYALKSFTLKQYDLLRREVVQKARRGEVAEATKFAARYAVFMSLANGTIQTIRDVLTGQITSGEEAVEKFPDQLMWETLSALGFGRYITERYLERGDVVGFLQSQLTPAAPLVQAVGKEVADFFSANREFEVEPILRTTPVVGATVPLMALWYNWVFGGFEEYLEERDQSNE
jgi:hypothetical protein